MTLIFSSLKSANILFASSDIVVSRQTDLKPEPIDLPMARSALRHRNGKYVLSGTAQKTIISGRTMVMWSGWLAVAAAIIKSIMARSKNGEDFVNPAEIIASLKFKESELKETSIIYHYIDKRHHLSRYCFNCEIMPNENLREIAASGSGTWNFFSSISFDRDIPLSKSEGREDANFYSRIAMHSLFEFNGTTSLDYLYGGWFEVTFANLSSFKFEKIPYAIKLWFKEGDSLVSGLPLFFGWYNEDNLVVTRFQSRQDGDRVQTDVNHFLTRDFLRRKPSQIVPDKIIKPFFVISIVVQEDYRTHHVDLSPYEVSGYKLEVGPQGVRCAWTHEIRQKLYDAEPAGPTVSLSDSL